LVHTSSFSFSPDPSTSSGQVPKRNKKIKAKANASRNYRDRLAAFAGPRTWKNLFDWIIYYFIEMNG
jgi:hypothetical protein